MGIFQDNYYKKHKTSKRCGAACTRSAVKISKSSPVAYGNNTTTHCREQHEQNIMTTHSTYSPQHEIHRKESSIDL